MKKIFLTLCLSAIFGMAMAQEVKTYSVYDTNQSGDVTVSDVTEVVDKVKSNVAAASTQQYVTADNLKTILSDVYKKLASIEAQIAEGKSHSTPQQSASFDNAKKYLTIGDTYTQTVVSNSGGAVTYISSNPSVASVNVSSGLVTAVTAGETIITAIIAATSEFDALAASYTVLVEEKNMLNGHEYVDLGLSVKWATCNIGAENNFDYGDYFAWGETDGYNSGKTNFSPGTDKYYKTGTKTVVDSDGFEITTNISGVTKYATSAHPGYDGFYDNKKILESSDDAASVNWGGLWRMPTIEECRELIDNCEFTWCQLNGIYGNKITGKNGKYIFLPANGHYNGSELTNVKSRSSYWSSSISEETRGAVRSMGGNKQYLLTSGYGDRGYGRGVRAVCP